jgi:hypothetical protein
MNMAQRHNSGERLPEPKNAFARWGGGAAVGFWAVGVQTLPDPWDKLGAVLSPGIGYIVGVVLDSIYNRISENSRKHTRLRDLSEIEEWLTTFKTA